MLPEGARTVLRALRQRNGNRHNRELLVHVDDLRRAHARATTRELKVGVDDHELAFRRARIDRERAALAANDEGRRTVLGETAAVEFDVCGNRATRLEIDMRVVLRKLPMPIVRRQ